MDTGVCTKWGVTTAMGMIIDIGNTRPGIILNSESFALRNAIITYIKESERLLSQPVSYLGVDKSIGLIFKIHSLCTYVVCI